jgi:hypothetical protein
MPFELTPTVFIINPDETAEVAEALACARLWSGQQAPMISAGNRTSRFSYQTFMLIAVFSRQISFNAGVENDIAAIPSEAAASIVRWSRIQP